MRSVVMAARVAVILVAVLLNIFSSHNEVTGKKSGPYVQPKGKWNSKLTLDTAIVNITYDSHSPFDVYGVSANCYKCQQQLLRENVSMFTYVIIDTTFEYLLVMQSSTVKGSRVLCNQSHHFSEHGHYQIEMRKGKSVKCIMKPVVDPAQNYEPILVTFGVLAGSALVWFIITEVCRRKHLGARWGLFRDNESLINADLGSPNHLTRSVSPPAETEVKEEKEKKPKRLKCLDTVRGLSLTIMVFVNFGGGGYYFFSHSKWNGLTVADLVFPWFMWIMGVSMSLSFRILRRKQVSNCTIFTKIVKRTLILFALGLFTSNNGDLTNYRIPGVLQRFAACYFVVAVVQLMCGPNSEDSQLRGYWWDPLRDVVALWSQWLFMLALLTIYVVVTYAIDIEGCPRGYTGPGGIGDNGTAVNCTGGVSSNIDKWLFGRHVYQRGTFHKLYRSTTYHDPEGILGTLTSVFLVFLGVQAGQTLFTYPHHRPRVIRWLLWAVLLGVVAVGLSGGTKNEGILPINKNIWSVSFIFATGSMAFILLTFCYVTIEVCGVWNGAPFIYPGMNSILVYCGHEWLGGHFPFSWDLDPYHTHADQLLMNTVGTACWIAISYYLYWIGFFLKI